MRAIYTKTLTDRLKVGVALKYIREMNWEAYWHAFAFDIGSNFDTGIYGMILGMSVSNFGPDVQYHGEGLEIPVDCDLNPNCQLAVPTEKFPVPLTFRLGIENKVMGPESPFIKNDKHSLIVSIDGIKPSDYVVYGSMGLEYGWQNLAFVRMGTHLNHDTAGLSLGAGANVRLGKWALTVDYAFVDYDILNYTNQLAIGLKF